MSNWLSRLREALHGPGYNLGLGLALILTAIFDAAETVFEGVFGLEVEAFWGLIILGVSHLGRGLVDFLDGLERIRSSKK